MTTIHDDMRNRPASQIRLSVVVPIYNESKVLLQLRRLIADGATATGCPFEIVFVNDGSRDGSDVILDGLAAADAHVKVLHFARNFGHQAAVQAGLAHASGDIVLLMDGDLQDDPTKLPDFLAAWRKGADVVYAVRVGRKEGAIKRFLFSAFYRVLNRISSIPMPMDAGNFSLLDRRVVDEVSRLRDSDRYLPGLRTWVGFRQVGIVVERKARYDDKPRVSMRGLFNLAKTAIFSFSAVPLTFFYLVAVASVLAAASAAGFAVYHKLLTGEAIPGWTSQVVVTCLFGSLNALGIAVLGEYVVRIFDQVRDRPHYIVARRMGESGRFAMESPPPLERSA